jgi:putative endonuclease
MTNYSHGHDAEKVAAQYLAAEGYTVRMLNWRHPRAEIDIIAQRPDGSMVFVEVKYRQSAAQGYGLEYITSAKLRQMTFAAELWVSVHHYKGSYSLAAIEVSGPGYEVSAFIDDLS